MDGKEFGRKPRRSELFPITLAGGKPVHSSSQRIGFVFPVHIWGIPGLLLISSIS